MERKRGNVLVVLLLILVTILVLSGFYLLRQNQQKLPSSETQLGNLPQTTSQKNAAPAAAPQLSQQPCTFPDFHFKVDCPPEVKTSVGMSVYKKTVSIQYFGKYQGQNQGWVDGVTIDITYNLLGQSSLREMADKLRLSMYQGDKIQLNTVKVGNTTGYKFRSSESDFILVTNGQNAYNEIDVSVYDSHNLNYQSIVDKILSSFQTTP